MIGDIPVLSYRDYWEAEKDFPDARLWFSPLDFAAFHGLKYGTVRRWVSEGRFLEMIYIGGHPKIPPDAPIPKFARPHKSRDGKQ